MDSPVSDLVEQSPRRTVRLPPREDDDALVMVTDLATELGITARTLRFYEDQGLIAPRRVGSSRVYSNRERARMIIILRGKRLGFSIKEIKAFLDLYDADPKGVTQMRALLDRIGERRRQLEDKREAIAQALQGLDDLAGVARGILAKAGSRKEKLTAQPLEDRFRQHRSPVARDGLPSTRETS